MKGAFTGAVASRAGKFQEADGGTLFLDEIGELPLGLQVKLLRALQERVVVRVGDNRPEKCDIRIVAATNRNLDEMIKSGDFREDLYYRLNVVNLWLPPLRERGDDVFIIAKALLSKFADELKSAVRGFSPQAFAAIKKYPWPGQHSPAREPHQEGARSVRPNAVRSARPGSGRRGANGDPARSKRPKKSSSASTCSRCSSATTATARRPRATSASIRGPSSATSRKSRTRCPAAPAVVRRARSYRPLRFQIRNKPRSSSK